VPTSEDRNHWTLKPKVLHCRKPFPSNMIKNTSWCVIVISEV
jgi:hypothetical protein